jgi:cytochrome b561
VRTYSRVAVTLHWVTAAAIAVEVGLGWRNVSQPAALAGLHEWLGFGILFATVARLALRLFARDHFAVAPFLARSVHAAFYVLLIGLPLSGWLQAERVHRNLGFVLFTLLLLHIAGAMKHHLREERNRLDWRFGAVLSGIVLLPVLASGAADVLLPRVMREAIVPPIALGVIDARRTPIFDGLVQPVFARNCISCHGPDKQKGELRLDSFVGVGAGGANGKIVMAGSPEHSEIVRRILLPPDDKEVMPPGNRRALSLAEGEILIWWIQSGAQPDTTITGGKPPPLLQGILQTRGVTSESAVFAAKVSEPSDSAMAAAFAAGFQVKRVAQHSGLLEARSRDSVDGARPDLAALEPLREQLVWLDLAGSAIADSDLGALAHFAHLQRLNLARTDVTDAGLVHLSELPGVEVLNLYGTPVTDAAVESLKRMPALLALYVGGTQMTDAAITRLKSAHHSLSVQTQAPPFEEKE